MNVPKTVGEIKALLKDVPDDFEFQIRTDEGVPFIILQKVIKKAF